MPGNISDDRNLVSHEKHELDYLLNKWDKAASKNNRHILTGQLKKFKADKAWAPHNREHFYKYVQDEDVLSLLEDKQTKTSPATVIREDTEEESTYTSIKKRAAVPRTKKKRALVPLLLMLLGLLVVAALVLFLFVYKPGGAARMTERTPGTAETGEQTTSAAEAEAETTAAGEEEAAALLEQFKQIVADNSPLLFVGDRAVLLPGQEAKLKAIVKSMTNLKKLDLTLSGHTADTGVPSREMELSKERALTVKDYLEQNSGVTNLEIATIGRGATEPLVKDVPVSKQQPNRRVEIVVNSAE